jgi:hypothetical protein
MAKERPDVPVELTTTVKHGVDFHREQFDAAVMARRRTTSLVRNACSMNN